MEDRARIEEERAKAQAVFSSIGDGAIATDEHGSIVRINRTALDMLGATEQETVGHWYPKVIEAEDAFGKPLTPIELPITKSIVEGKPITHKSFYRRKDGSLLPVSATVSPVLLDGKPIGAVEVFRDITHELEFDRAKGEFISLASHQLKTPPTAIKWSLGILRDGTVGPLNEAQKDLIDGMYGITERMIETVNALLNISRIDLGTFNVDPVPVDYADLARDSVLEYGPKIKEKKLKLKETYGKDVPPVPADRGLAKIILDNLVGNAVKYTPEGGAIGVSVTLAKDEDDPAGAVRISVADSGMGIPQAQQSRIFSKMFRASNVKEVEGTGFGLYITKFVVDLAGGRIWFDSKEGEGTTFQVRLPLAGMRRKEGTSKLTA